MRAGPKPLIRVVVPVVTAAAADIVFAKWADEFDVWSGWSDLRGSGRWRHRAELSFHREPLQSPSFIYIATAPTGPVKVGLSEKPICRVGALRDYEAIVAIAGQDRQAERRLHEQLKDYQVNGGRQWAGHLGVKYEWFERLSPVLSLAYRLANAADSTIEELFARRRGMVA